MDYNMIVTRLTEYRKAAKLVQSQMADYIELSQSQYSKIEKGTCKLSYEGARKLYEKGWDMDLIITGEGTEALPKELRTILVERGSSLRRRLEQCGKLMDEWMQADTSRDNLGYKLLCEYLKKDEPVLPLRRLRTTWGENQENMAELVGVDLKKYRLLEKGETQPDAELLGRIYELTSCKPSFFFDEEAYYLTVVNEEAKTAPDRVQQLKNILEKKEEK